MKTSQLKQLIREVLGEGMRYGANDGPSDDQSSLPHIPYDKTHDVPSSKINREAQIGQVILNRLDMLGRSDEHSPTENEYSRFCLELRRFAQRLLKIKTSTPIPRIQL